MDRAVVAKRGIGTGSVVLVLLAVNLVANYWRAQEFGLYDDDYLFTLPPMSWGWVELWDMWVYAVTTLPQGRPIWWVVNPTFAWLLGFLPTLTWSYVFGLLLSTTAAVALYRFFLRFVSPLGAVSGALFYLLFPPDTSKVIIMHQVAFQFTTLMLLGALGLYLSRWKWWSYGVLTAVLLTFEPYFLPFVLAPMLIRWDSVRAFLVESLRHGAICSGVFVAVMLLRHWAGDDRTSEMVADLGTLIFRVVTAPGIGMWAVLETMVGRPWGMLVTAGAVEYVVMGVIAIGLYRFLRASDRDLIPLETGRLWQFFWAGIALAAITYVYRFHDWYYPPVKVVGRVSGLHQAAAMGFALAVGCGVDLSRGCLAKWKEVWRLCLVALAIYLGLLVGFFQRVQEAEYVEGWEFQRGFWKDIIAGAGDVEADEMVIVDLDGALAVADADEVGTAGFRFQRLAMPGNALTDFAKMPPGWEASERMRGVFRGSNITLDDEGIRIDRSAHPLDGSIVIFRFNGRNWARSNEPIVIAGRLFRPRVAELEALSAAETTELFDRVFLEGDLRVKRPELDDVNYEGVTKRRARKRERDLAKQREREKRPNKNGKRPDLMEFPARPAR